MKFRLPKEFAEKWMAALRSGKYKQGSGRLFLFDAYCCIGVAGAVCGVKDRLMDDKGLFSPKHFCIEKEWEKIKALFTIEELIGDSNNKFLQLLCA